MVISQVSGSPDDGCLVVYKISAQRSAHIRGSGQWMSGGLDTGVLQGLSRGLLYRGPVGVLMYNQVFTHDWKVKEV